MARMINIVPENLEKEICKRSLTKGDVSETIGHNRNFISESMRKGRLSRSAVKGLESIYNIPPESYCITEKTEPVNEPEELPEPEPKTDPIDYHRLGRVIYNAVYQAVKKAWSE